MTTPYDADSTAVNQELTADLVGDYVFSDADFVKSLYAGDRTVFEKVYDEVQYLSRVVSAGSKEGRQLEKVKKAFADAYREGGTNTASGEVRYKVYDRPDFTKDEWSIVNRRKHSEFDNPKYDLDANKKFLYANEKGMTVFAIYSKHDVEDPTVLYGSRGKRAENDYSTLSAWQRGEQDAKQSRVKQNRKTLNGILNDIFSAKGNKNVGVSSLTGRESTAENVPVPLRERGSNGGRNFGDGPEDFQGAELRKYDNESSEDMGTSSLITFSNDYETIRRFLKEGENIKPWTDPTNDDTLETKKQAGEGLLQKNPREPDIEIGRDLGAKAKNYSVMDLATGEFFRFSQGTKIQNVEIFAGQGTKKNSGRRRNMRSVTVGLWRIGSMQKATVSLKHRRVTEGPRFTGCSVPV